MNAHLKKKKSLLSVGAACLALASFSGACADLAHQIREGDTLYTLSDAYLEDPLQWSEVAEYNGIANPRRLQPGTTLLIPESLLRRKPGGAEVLHVAGSASFQPRFGPSETLQVGVRLIDGDVVRTTENGSVTLRLADGSLLTLSPSSVLNLDRLRYNVRTGRAASALQLDDGRVESRVQPQHGPGRFILKTPKMAAGVRGTAFGVTTSPAEGSERNTVDVLEGAVDVSAAQRRTERVAAGYGGVLPSQAAAPILVKTLPAAPNLERLPTLITRPVVDLPFDAVSGAVAYRVRITPADQPDFILYEHIQPEPRHRVESLPDGRYLVQARAISAEGLEGLPAQLTFELDAQPVPPVTVSPLHEDPHETIELKFAWLEVEGVNGYVMQLASEPDFQNLLHEVKGPQNQHVYAGRLAAGRYYWRVRSVQGSELGPWGDTRILEYRPAIVGTPSSEQMGSLLVLRWEGEPGQRFVAELSPDQAFTTLTTEGRLDQPQWKVEGLTAGDYFFRVKAIDADGYERRYSTPHLLRMRDYLTDGSGGAISDVSGAHIDLLR